MSETKLKPCPFCGSDGNLGVDVIDVSENECAVHCLNLACQTTGPSAEIETLARVRWNTRPREHALLEALEKCAKAFCDIMETESLTRDGGASPEDLDDYDRGLELCIGTAIQAEKYIRSLIKQYRGE